MNIYNKKEAEKIFNHLLCLNPRKDVDFIKLNHLFLSKNQHVVDSMYCLFCAAAIIPLTNRAYQRVLQFFILTLYKKAIFNNPDHDGEQYAYKYALNTFYQNISQEDVNKINEVISKSSYSKENIVDFFSRIEVLSSWETTGSPIKIHDSVTIDNIVQKTIDSLSSSVISNIPNIVTSITNPLAQMAEDLIKNNSILNALNKTKEDDVKNLVGDLKPQEYYQKLIQNKELKSWEEAINFFSLIVSSWANKNDEAKELNEKLKQVCEYTFNPKFKETSVQASLYTEDLFTSYLVRTIEYVDFLKNKDLSQIDEYLKIISEYCDKINKIYLEQIQNEMNVFKKFLQAKIRTMD